MTATVIAKPARQVCGPMKDVYKVTLVGRAPGPLFFPTPHLPCHLPLFQSRFVGRGRGKTRESVWGPPGGGVEGLPRALGAVGGRPREEGEGHGRWRGVSWDNLTPLRFVNGLPGPHAQRGGQGCD